MADAGRLRVAMIIQSYLPRLGGAEKQLAAVCSRLREKGIESVVITRRYGGLPAYEVIEQTPVYRVPAPRPKALAALCYVLFGLRKIKQIDPQIVHVHELLSPTDMGILARRLWKKPLVVKVLRGGKLGDLDKLHHRSTGSTRIRRMARQVDAFIAISHEIERELTAEGIEKERCRFLPNGVDVDFYRPLLKSQKALLRKRMGLPDGFLCVYSGRLAPEKGLPDLLRAWQKITQQFSDASLLLLGSGEMEDKLREMAGRQVIFAGYVTETLSYYQAADAFVLPSETEGLSNAMLESMACGLLVAASRVGAAVDLIEPGQNGLLFQPGNVEEIVQVLQSLIEHPRERESMGAAGRERICRDYSLDRTVEGLAALYRELAGRGAC